MSKHSTELHSHNTALAKKVANFKQWIALLSCWGIKHDMAETVEILNKLSEKSNNLLKIRKKQYVRGFLDTASDISDEIEKYHIKKYQNQLFTSTQTLFCKAEKIASNSNDNLLKEIQNFLTKNEKPEELLQSIDFYNKAMDLINQLIRDKQASFKKVPNKLDDQTILAKIDDVLKNPGNYRSFCKPVKIKSIQNLINSATHQNCNDLMLAIFGDKQFIERFFTKLYGKPVLLNEKDDKQGTAILWRLTLSKNTIIYILGITTDKLLKHSEQKWFRLLRNFNSVLIYLENFEQQSDQNSITLMVMLNLIHHDAIHLIEPISDSSETSNHQHFLFQYLTHAHFGPPDDYQKISNWIIQSIFPYNGIKQYVKP